MSFVKSPLALRVTVALIVTLVLLAGWWIYERSFAGVDPVVMEQEHTWSLREVPAFEATILPTGGTPLVDSGEFTFAGEPVMVACSVCHTTRQPELANASGAQLESFHQGLQMVHGDLNCLSCHHGENYDQLRRADGSFIAYEQSMQLCAQCHGPQYRDYQHGSHGGMTGYWDLDRGPRIRNNCMACHDPHAPAYGMVRPVFFPHDLATGEDHSISSPGRPTVTPQPEHE